MRRPCLAAAALLALASLGTQAGAGVIVTRDPGFASIIEAQLAWDGAPRETATAETALAWQAAARDPEAKPGWEAGLAYGFQLVWTMKTGVLTLALDLDRDGRFARDETTARGRFGPEGLGFAGLGFSALSIAADESDTKARSVLDELTINGERQEGIKPGGGPAEVFYAPSDARRFDDIVITGQLSFSNDGRGQERPTWTVAFRAPTPGGGGEVVAQVPEPAGLALLGVGLLGLALAARRRT